MYSALPAAATVSPGRVRAALIASALLTLLSGCTLPQQQLALPDPVGGELVPVHKTSAAGPAPRAHLYPGSGNFAVDPTAGGAAGAADLSAAGTAGDGAAGMGAGAGTGAGVSVGRDGITIELVGASVGEAAKAILGDVLGHTYVVASEAKASITLRTLRPVSKDGLLELFETVLEAENLALVADGDIYRITPSAAAHAAGAPLRTHARAAASRGGLETDIMPLRFVSALEMERIVRAAMPSARILRADSARNLLMVSGTRADLASMSELVQVFDVDWMRGMSFGLFPVESSDPEAVASELDMIFANDSDGPGKGLVRFVGNRRLKSVLVISPRPEYLRKAEIWMKRIDQQASATERQVYVYHVQNRPATEVALILQKVYRPVARSGDERAGGLARRALPLAESAAPGMGPETGVGAFAQPALAGPGSQQGFAQGGFGQGGFGQGGFGQSGGFGQAGQPSALPLAAGPADTAAANLERATLGGGDDSATSAEEDARDVSIVADEPNNSLVITATPTLYRRIRAMLKTIDVAGTQVMIEATIAEVTLNDQLKLGVRWFIEKGGSAMKFTDSLAGLTAPVFPGFSYFLNVADINAVVRALGTVTDVNVVSTPTLMVVENKKATLQVGDEVPIATQSAVSVTTPDAPIVNAVSFRSTGVILGITARVSDNGKVVLDIEQEVSDVVPTTTSTIDSPTIQQRRVKTTVNVQDGQTVLLAGLIQDRATRERDQVPILGDLPYVGNAFKSKTDTIKRTELLIAITPQVMKEPQQISDVTSEFRDKLNFRTRPQRETPPDHREDFDRLVR